MKRKGGISEGDRGEQSRGEQKKAREKRELRQETTQSAVSPGCLCLL